MIQIILLILYIFCAFIPLTANDLKEHYKIYFYYEFYLAFLIIIVLNNI